MVQVLDDGQLPRRSRRAHKDLRSQGPTRSDACTSMHGAHRRQCVAPVCLRTGDAIIEAPVCLRTRAAQSPPGCRPWRTAECRSASAPSLSVLPAAARRPPRTRHPCFTVCQLRQLTRTFVGVNLIMAPGVHFFHTGVRRRKYKLGQTKQNPSHRGLWPRGSRWGLLVTDRCVLNHHNRTGSFKMKRFEIFCSDPFTQPGEWPER